MANANLPDIKTLIQAGFDPKTRLPRKISNNKCTAKADIKRALRIIDEQDAVNRFVWYNLPCNITSQELERMLYYKGQLCFFYMKDLNEFYFMPYALDGTIDFYGRYNTIHPVPMTSGTDDKAGKAQAEYLSQLKLKCVYGINVKDIDLDLYTNSAVLLHDYTKQLSQTIIPRVDINEPLLDMMAECPAYMRTSLIEGTGISGVRVGDADQADSVLEGANSLQDAALVGHPWVPIIGNVEFQELTSGQLTNTEEYMLAMQSLDNLRLSTYGIDNGGLFEKKAHELQTEADINGGPVGLVMQDGLAIRQQFCNIVNSIWGIGIWCEPAQNISGTDVDGDGQINDEDTDGSHTGIETGDSFGGQDNE